MHNIFRTRKVVFHFIIYFIILFTLFEYLSIKYFKIDIGKFSQSQPKKIVKIKSLISLCINIRNVETVNDTIIIHYQNNIQTNDDNVIKYHFALKTKWERQSIFFPIGSANILSKSDKKIALKFHLPFVDNYSAKLVCAVPGFIPRSSYKDLKRYILKSFSIDLESKELYDSKEYSKMKCYHKDNWLKRWCLFSNIPFFGNHLYFLSPAVFHMPEPFIVPGPRAPPFDRESDRLENEPVVLNFNKSSLEVKLTEITDYSFIYGTFHNTQMLWHMGLDFLVPLYNHARLLGYDFVKNKNATKIYLKSSGIWIYDPLVSFISDKSVDIIYERQSSLFINKGCLGIEKLESNPKLNRGPDDMIAFKYEVTRENVRGMRELLLKSLKFEDKLGENGKPLVLIVKRESSNRKVINMNTIIEKIKESCYFCDVRNLKFEDLSITEQVEVASKASVLIGLHGSGLTHVLWMRESTPELKTSLFEILPYGYCRDWYKTAANAAGVEYIPIMNKNPPTNVEDSHLQSCIKNLKACNSVNCHDILRDQSIDLEIDTFLEFWEPVLNDLKRAYDQKLFSNK